MSEITAQMQCDIPKELRCDFCRHFRQKTYGKRNRHYHRTYKYYCKCYDVRLRKLVRSKQCPCFADLTPRKDGHVYKTFTAVDLFANFVN